MLLIKAGSYSRLIDSCITQLEAQGLSKTCNESQEEEEEEANLDVAGGRRDSVFGLGLRAEGRDLGASQQARWVGE